MQPESMDAFSYQEVVLPGQILASVLKDALFTALIKLRTQYMVVGSSSQECSGNVRWRCLITRRNQGGMLLPVR